MKKILNIFKKVDKPVIKEDHSPDIIKPPPKYIEGVLSGGAYTDITREYTNYYREKEGLPLLESGSRLGSFTECWFYDMVKKYEGVSEDQG